MSEEEMRNIIYLKNKPISSCKDLHKYFIGRHNKPIVVYLTPKFEIEFENIFGKLECLEQENKKYKEVINKAIKHVSSLSSRGRDCMIYADVKKEILDILKEVD